MSCSSSLLHFLRFNAIPFLFILTTFSKFLVSLFYFAGNSIRLKEKIVFLMNLHLHSKLGWSWCNKLNEMKKKKRTKWFYVAHLFIWCVIQKFLVWIMTFQRNQILLLMNLLSSSAFQCATNFSIESFANESQFIRYSHSGCEWRKKSWNHDNPMHAKDASKRRKKNPCTAKTIVSSLIIMSRIFFFPLIARHRSKSFAC